MYTIALLRRFSAFCDILISDWLDDVMQSTAPYVTINLMEVNMTEDLHLCYFKTFIQLFAVTISD